MAGAGIDEVFIALPFILEFNRVFSLFEDFCPKKLPIVACFFWDFIRDANGKCAYLAHPARIERERLELINECDIIRK